MTETSTFSSSGLDAIQTTLDSISLDTQKFRLSANELEESFDIERTAEVILREGWKTIALQFPDPLLPMSVPIFRALRLRVPKDVGLYVLADTSYGSCCVDEVAASHIDAQAIVHYGHACLSEPARLPVVYVFGRKDLDVHACVAELAMVVQQHQWDDENNPTRTILLKSAVEYAWTIGDLLSALEHALPSVNILYSSLATFVSPSSHGGCAPRATTDGDVIDGQATYEQPTSSRSGATPDSMTNTATNETSPSLILYIGPASPQLISLCLTHPTIPVYALDPPPPSTASNTTSAPQTTSAILQTHQTSVALRRRYALVTRARDADTFGLLVGTLSTRSYLPLLSHLRKLLRTKKKKSYTVSVGKLNPAKLGNFAEVECWVLVACPEGSLIDSKEFPAPIITPYELELALRSEVEWGSSYLLDFDRVIQSSSVQAGASGVKDEADDGGEDETEDNADGPRFSLVSGKYRTPKTWETPSRAGEKGKSAAISSSTDLVPRPQAGTLTAAEALPGSSAAAFLAERSWRGLEARMNEDAPSLLEQGREGIARGYGEDNNY